MWKVVFIGYSHLISFKMLANSSKYYNYKFEFSNIIDEL